MNCRAMLISCILGGKTTGKCQKCTVLGVQGRVFLEKIVNVTCRMLRMHLIIIFHGSLSRS